MALISEPLELKWRSAHGAIVGQSTRSGSIARLHTESVQRTQTNKPRRDWVMRSLISSWRALSTSEQMDWDAFGVTWPQLDRYGNMIELSGWDWFVKLNSVCLLWNDGFNFAPPTSPVPDYLPTMGFVDGGPGLPIYLDLFPLVIPPGRSIRLHRLLNLPTSTMVSFPLTFYRSLGAGFAINVPVAQPAEMSVEVLAHYFSAVAMDAFGRMSPLVESRIVRAA